MSGFCFSIVPSVWWMTALTLGLSRSFFGGGRRLSYHQEYLSCLKVFVVVMCGRRLDEISNLID
ncbi:unnamed protein product [Brassica rapa subsp. narinosa]|uniref:(rape) hypothetical protein n=1 Tax=Brassica napus TaxID=3708 RepID=A0A816X3K7_BRANA|nr:unnamed protein product [Brassica napus]